MIDVKTIAIGIQHFAAATDGRPMQMRYALIDDKWVPDLLVDEMNGTINKPPSCFEPTDEVIAALWDAYTAMVKEQTKTGRSE